MPHHRPRRPNPERRSTIDHFNAVEAEALRQEDPEFQDINPGRRSAYAGMSLAAATRRNLEDEAASRPQSAAQRLSTQTGGLPGDQSLAGYTTTASLSRPRLATRTSSSTSTTLEQHRLRSTTLTNDDNRGGSRMRPNLNVRIDSSSRIPLAEASGSGGGSGVRRSITTSRALLNRQDRYRGSNRDNAVLVESDSD